jgi:hypothetical protein
MLADKRTIIHSNLGVVKIMKKTGICLVLFVSFLIAFCSINAGAEEVISIVNYSLKPICIA